MFSANNNQSNQNHDWGTHSIPGFADIHRVLIATRDSGLTAAISQLIKEGKFDYKGTGDIRLKTVCFYRWLGQHGLAMRGRAFTIDEVQNIPEADVKQLLNQAFRPADRNQIFSKENLSQLIKNNSRLIDAAASCGLDSKQFMNEIHDSLNIQIKGQRYKDIRENFLHLDHPGIKRLRSPEENHVVQVQAPVQIQEIESMEESAQKRYKRTYESIVPDAQDQLRVSPQGHQFTHQKNKSAFRLFDTVVVAKPVIIDLTVEEPKPY